MIPRRSSTGLRTASPARPLKFCACARARRPARPFSTCTPPAPASAPSQQPLLAVSLSDGVIDEEHIGNLVCDMATQPDMQWLRTENTLRVVNRESATPSTALLLAELHADRVLITPVFGQGEFVGCIVAKLPHLAPEHDDVTVLDGATALQEHAGDLIHLALVLDELRRRALHDAVTGLPNLP